MALSLLEVQPELGPRKAQVYLQYLLRLVLLDEVSDPNLLSLPFVLSLLLFLLDTLSVLLLLIFPLKLPLLFSEDPFLPLALLSDRLLFLMGIENLLDIQGSVGILGDLGMPSLHAV